MESNSWNQPVVPQTVGISISASLRKFLAAASGEVNSMATSAGAAEFKESLRSILMTAANPYEGASDSMIFPILP